MNHPGAFPALRPARALRLSVSIPSSVPLSAGYVCAGLASKMGLF